MSVKSVSSKCFLWLAVLSVTLVPLDGRYWPKRDAEENDDHLLNILRDHEIIPDLIDDAPHADILEVIFSLGFVGAADVIFSVHAFRLITVTSCL